MRDGGSARPFACGEQPEGLSQSGGHRRLKASRLPVRAARREGRQAGGCRARIGAAPDGGVRHLRRQESTRPRQCHHAGVRSEDARHAALLHDARVVPLHLREIIERACAFEPSARYQTVAQLGAAVDAVRRGVREPSDANSFSAAGDGARGSRSDGWRGGGASGSSQQARHFASSGPTDSANAQAPGGSPFRQAASSRGQTSGHDATCGPESSPPRSSDSKGGEGAASGAFSCLKRLVSVLGVVLCVFIVAFVFALGWSNGWWGGQDDSASSDPDLYKVIDAESGVTHTEAIKNYVGMNAASVGYTGGSGIRYDSYGDHTIAVAFVAPDGAYVDPENDELLKQYVVTGQNLEAGSDVVFTAYKTKSGLSTIYGDYQSQDEVVLAVTKVGEPEDEVNLVPTESAPDKYTRYVKNYVGRNLASCGYIAMGGFLADYYGEAYVRFGIAAEDGSYVDVEDKNSVSQYVVVGQSVEPNTEFHLSFEKNPDGTEKDDTPSPSLTNITLTVAPL